jgi:group I intron endonuclease
MADVRCIYRIVHTDSGKCYVGQTVNLRSRKSTHLCALRAGRHHSRYLQRAFDLHGEDAFSFEILERLDGAESNESRTQREGFWISKFRPVYNWSAETPTRAGAKDSDETRRRKSEAARGNKNATGATFTEEDRSARRERMIGNKRAAGTTRSIELRARQSNLMRGNSFARKGTMKKDQMGAVHE